MVFKTNNPGCSSGGGCGCSGGPCCSTVWGYLLDDYSSHSLELFGYDSGLTLTTNPLTGSFVGTYVVDGVTYYQCSINPIVREYSSSNADYYSPANPRRYGSNIGGSGPAMYRYSEAYATIEVPVCSPPSIKITVGVLYEYRATTIGKMTDIESEIESAGYEITGGFYRVKTDGDILHRIGSGSSNPWNYLIWSEYSKTVTGAVNLMSGFPSTINVVPAWNPAGISATFALS